MATHILGIRHHGPGSARNVRAYLEELRPDIVLVEGPPEANALLLQINETTLKPPVAILCYNPDQPKQSVFYPFAEFSPEWQAILYARKHQVPVRFIDLPLAHVFALDKRSELVEQESENPGEEMISNGAVFNKMDAFSAAGNNKKNSPLCSSQESDSPGLMEKTDSIPSQIKADPISYLAKVGGYEDGEAWWEQMFEQRSNNAGVFDAVMEAMSVLREAVYDNENERDLQREAYMRKVIRDAGKEMYSEIAVVCGAWHAPALTNAKSQKTDQELLKGIPKIKVACTWVPWVYSRLSFDSGYGAGVQSPGWYEYVWNYPDDNGSRWLVNVARLFRDQMMDIAPAHVIEAVRLANMLSIIRNKSTPSLQEFNESVLSVFCQGDPLMMKLLFDSLVVGNKMGQVPEDIPKPPLQSDIEKLQKKLRLPATADWKEYHLDLRKENDLERSVFLHRLLLLGINWGEKQAVGGKGTFKENWRLQWQPSFAVDIIEKGTWGNNVADAANQYAIHHVKKSDDIGPICSLLEEVIPANLPEAASCIIHTINDLASTNSDIIQWMSVIPPLVRISRYGNVRRTDAGMILEIVRSMITRICISLPVSCVSLNEEQAVQFADHLMQMQDAVTILQDAEISSEWYSALQVLISNTSTSPLIAGYATRLLSDNREIEQDELVKVFYYAMSAVTIPQVAASWLEGFLKGSGTLLLLNDDLWTVVNNWVVQLNEENFISTLPILRRTFAGFTNAERRKLGEKSVQGKNTKHAIPEQQIDESRATTGIHLLMKMMGYKIEHT